MLSQLVLHPELVEVAREGEASPHHVVAELFNSAKDLNTKKER